MMILSTQPVVQMSNTPGFTGSHSAVGNMSECISRGCVDAGGRFFILIFIQQKTDAGTFFRNSNNIF